MANKKKTANPSPIQQLIAFSAPKADKSTLSLPISETENINIEVNPLLSADEMVSFVDSVTDALFLNDRYTPVLYDLVHSNAILAYYTNLKVSITNEDLINLVFNTDIISDIKKMVNKIQYNKIIAAIHKSITFKKQEILSTQSARLEESIHQIELLTEATSTITNQFNNIDMKQIADATAKLSNMSEHDIVDNILNIKFDDESVAIFEAKNNDYK